MMAGPCASASCAGAVLGGSQVAVNGNGLDECGGWNGVDGDEGGIDRLFSVCGGLSLMWSSNNSDELCSDARCPVQGSPSSSLDRAPSMFLLVPFQGQQAIVQPLQQRSGPYQ